MHVVLSECPASSSQKTEQNHSNKTINHDMLHARRCAECSKDGGFSVCS